MEIKIPLQQIFAKKVRGHIIEVGIILSQYGIYMQAFILKPTKECSIGLRCFFCCYHTQYGTVHKSTKSHCKNNDVCMCSLLIRMTNNVNCCHGNHVFTRRTNKDFAVIFDLHQGRFKIFECNCSNCHRHTGIHPGQQ